MGLVAQWDGMVAGLPAGWREVGVRIHVDRPGDAARAAALLGALSPGVAGDELHLRVTATGASAHGVARRLLARLDAEGIGGALDLQELVEAEADSIPAASREPEPEATLAEEWDALVATLPEDWSDALYLVEFRSSDELAPAALALAPVNPSRHEGTLAFRFRVARRYGYGAAPTMARRCLERLDELEIPGVLKLLEALSDTRPVLTQGPTFVVADRAV